MNNYTIKVRGKIVKFKAENDTAAKIRALRISPYYSDLKRSESRWWLLVYVVLFLLGLLGAQSL
jgi:hypothetical protein